MKSRKIEAAEDQFEVTTEDGRLIEILLSSLPMIPIFEENVFNMA